MSKPTVLFLDDEERIVKSLRLIFLDKYEVLTATDPEAALDLVSAQQVDVVVSDQRMPKVTGVEFLAKVKAISPKSVRILLTGYSDLDAIMDSVNKGEVFRYVQKPWENEKLHATVDLGVEAAKQLSGLTNEQASHYLNESIQEAPEDESGCASILVLDQQAEIYNQVKDLLAEHEISGCNAYHADSMDRALEILGEKPIGIVISDIRVGNADVGYLLKTLKANFPQVVTIIASEVRDADIAVELINEGQIYRYLPKRLPIGLLKLTIQSALRHHKGLIEKPELQHLYRTENAGQAPGDAAQKGVWSALKDLGKRLLMAR